MKLTRALIHFPAVFFALSMSAFGADKPFPSGEARSVINKIAERLTNFDRGHVVFLFKSAPNRTEDRSEIWTWLDAQHERDQSPRDDRYVDQLGSYLPTQSGKAMTIVMPVSGQRTGLRDLLGHELDITDNIRVYRDGAGYRLSETFNEILSGSDVERATGPTEATMWFDRDFVMTKVVKETPVILRGSKTESGVVTGEKPARWVLTTQVVSYSDSQGIRYPSRITETNPKRIATATIKADFSRPASADLYPDFLRTGLTITDRRFGADVVWTREKLLRALKGKNTLDSRQLADLSRDVVRHLTSHKRSQFSATVSQLKHASQEEDTFIGKAKVNLIPLVAVALLIIVFVISVIRTFKNKPPA